MSKKKILIISRTIFPAQFPRSHRATELAKELARQGHNVTLYAVLGSYDYSDFEQINNLKVRNIGKMIFSKLNSDGNESLNLIDRILHRLLNRLIEFPDIELMSRIPKIIKTEKNVDLLISIAIPYPIHWGCALSKALCKQNFPGIWAADCGDPYMGNKIIKPKIFFYFKYVEKWFCRKADFIVIPHEGAKKGYYEEFNGKIRVIPQGFRFDKIELYQNTPVNSIPTFAFAGVFYAGFRDPSMFLEYLSQVDIDFRFIIYTSTRELLKPYINKLNGKLDTRDYIPREQLLYHLGKMDFLVNFENGNSYQSPSKLIDYSMVKRPILSIPSGSLPCEVINEFLSGNYNHQFIVENIEQYNISNVARQFVSLSDPIKL